MVLVGYLSHSNQSPSLKLKSCKKWETRQDDRKKNETSTQRGWPRSIRDGLGRDFHVAIELDLDAPSDCRVLLIPYEPLDRDLTGSWTNRELMNGERSVERNPDYLFDTLDTAKDGIVPSVSTQIALEMSTKNSKYLQKAENV